MAKEQRFERVYTQGALQITEIWVDKETGVNYLFHASGNAGGLTPLLDRDGKPVVSPLLNRCCAILSRRRSGRGAAILSSSRGAGAGGSGCPAPSCLQTSGGRHCA